MALKMKTGLRGKMLLLEVWYVEKLALLEQEAILEPRMHAKDSGAIGAFTVTHGTTRYTKAELFSEVGKQTEMLAR